MNRLITRLLLAVAVLGAGCLAAGCAQGGGLQGGNLAGAVASLSPDAAQSPDATQSPEASPSPSPERTFTFTPRTRSPRPTAEATTAPAPVPVATTEASAQAPSPSESATETGSGSSLIWLWIVLGVIVIAVVTALIARRSGRRSAVAANWSAKVADVSAKGAALEDAMSLAQAQGTLVAADASGRSADIDRRADDLAQTLYAMRETAPNEMERTRVADVLASLQALRSAVNAERTSGGDRAQAEARVHARLMSFEAALRALRSPTDYRL